MKSKANRKPYTVILKYPATICDGETQTYIEWATAGSADRAIEIVRRKASKTNNGLVKPGDMEMLYVFAGHLTCETCCMD